MKYKVLRACIKSKVVQKPYFLRDCDLVIDGRSYFSDTYKKSGCQFILGGEYDRYANYLKNTLNSFIKSNVTCYVVINGGIKAELVKRKEIHQNVIDSADAVKPGEENYNEPIFVKDVYKEVLEELNIKYFVTEYDSRDEIFNVARKLNCPVLTSNYEYSLYRVSCITPNSMEFNKERNRIACTIFELTECGAAFSMPADLMPIFMTLVDEDSLHFKKLPEVIGCRRNNLIPSVLRWVRRQSKENAVTTIKKNLKDETERASFSKSYYDHVNLCRKSLPSMAVAHFESDKKQALLYDDNKWFVKGVANGRVAIPYINLKNNGSFSGSWVVFDKEKEDAMLLAMDIVKHAYGLLTNSRNQNGKISFIGRKFDKSSVWDIESSLKIDISNEGLFDKERNDKVNTKDCTKKDLFRIFLCGAMPGFNFEELRSVPEDCWIIIISLVYFSKLKTDFNLFAFSILMSYVMLGPVSETVGVIKRGNFLVSHNVIDEEDKSKTNMFKSQDCTNATNKLMDLFYVPNNIKTVFDRKILHTFAEFQHCFQHMNYLNRLCGEKTKCTIYYKAFNATFVYNAYLKMKVSDRPMKYFEDILGKSPVLDFYNKIKRVFEDCLLSVK